MNKKEGTDVQAGSLVGEQGSVVALAENYGCPSRKEGGSHMVNIDGVAKCHKCFQGSSPASESLVERRSVP